jgi:hypothetical protein
MKREKQIQNLRESEGKEKLCFQTEKRSEGIVSMRRVECFFNGERFVS